MPLRILIVDDNVDLVDSLLSVLEHFGHVGCGATSGAAALERMQESLPDVALVDVGMPGMTGLELAAEVRRQPWGRDLLLIALTGWGREQDHALARDAGFDHVVVKPVDLEFLRVMFDRIGAVTPLAASRSDARSQATHRT